MFSFTAVVKFELFSLFYFNFNLFYSRLSYLTLLSTQFLKALHSKTIIIRNGIANIQPQETSQGPGVAFEYKGLIYRLVFDKAELRDTWLRLLSRGRHETEYNQGNKDQSPALENVQSNIQNTQTENQHPVERLPSYHSAVAEIPQPNQQRLPAWQTQSLSSSSYSTENRPPPYSSTQHDSAKPLP